MRTTRHLGVRWATTTNPKGLGRWSMDFSAKMGYDGNTETPGPST